MFGRYLTTIFVSVFLIAGAQWYRLWSAPAASGISHVRTSEIPGATEEMRRTWSEMEDQKQRRDGYVHFEARLIEAMQLDEISLRDAVERSFYYCLQHYPEHLVNINNADEGLPIKMKVAMNLVRSLEARQETSDRDPAEVAHFQCELAALPYGQDAGPSVTPQ